MIRRLSQVLDSKLGRSNIDPRLVWIFGSPRSGSTWLLKMLGDHEAVVPVNEPLIGSYLGPFLADLPGVDAEAFDSSNFILRRVARNDPNHFFAEEFREAWLPALADLMRSRFRAHAMSKPRNVPLSRCLVVIKEPNGSQSADIISEALPRSRFLFLLRDGRDVVDSQLAANQPGAWMSQAFPGVQGIADEDRRDFVVACALKWLWTTQVVQDAFSKHPGPKLMLRYEDLRRDPTSGMRSVFEWLETERDEPAIAATVERHSFERLPAERRGPRAFTRAARPGLWRENFTADERAAVERIIGPKLRELGYEPDDSLSAAAI